MILRARAASLRTAPRASRAGLTLLELLLVMAILGLVLGGGLGLFAALDLGKRQAVGLVKNVVRSAQNTAIATQAPARVRIDTKDGEAGGWLRAEALRVIGTWHFEGRDVKGFGMEGAAPGELFSEDGFVGEALRFVGAFGEAAVIPVNLDPAFDLTDGFALECALRWEDAGGGKAVAIGSSVALELGRTGALRGRFRAAVEGAGAGQARRGAPVVVETPPGALSPERWSVVRLAYDREELTLTVDGVPLARTVETAPVWQVEGPLQLSDGTRPFPGSIDALVVSAVVADEPVVLPETVRFGKGTPALVHFAAGGGLDRRRHPEPVRIGLVFDDGTEALVAVGMYGTVE